MAADLRALDEELDLIRRVLANTKSAASAIGLARNAAEKLVRNALQAKPRRTDATYRRIARIVREMDRLSRSATRQLEARRMVRENARRWTRRDARLT